MPPNRVILLCSTLFAASALFVVWSLNRQRDASGWVDHTNQVLIQCQRVRSLFIDAETGERGFLITGLESFQAPYDRAIAALPGERRRLRQLAMDNPSQLRRLDRLDAVADIRLNSMAETLRIYQDQRIQAAQAHILAGVGRDAMDQFRSILTQVEAEENRLLDERIRGRNRNSLNVTWAAGSTCLLGLALVCLADRQQRSHAAEKLSFQRSEQELRILEKLVERAPMGIIMLDRRLRTIQVSRRWLDDSGVTREAAIGRSHYETFPDLPEHWAELHRRGLTGESLAGKEESCLTPDGQEHWVNWQIVPWGDSGEKTGGIVIYSDDVTDRKLAERALTASESRYRGLFEHMNQGIAYLRMIPSDEPVHDRAAAPDFVYVSVNPQFEVLTGLTEVTGRRITEVFPRIRELDPDVISVFEKVVLTGEPQKIERFLNVLGQWHAMSVYSPEIGFLVVVFDVNDDRKQMETQAREWQRAFQESQSGIAIVDSTTGKIIAANEAYAGGLGYTTDELTGRDAGLLYPPEELAHRAEALRKAHSERGHALFETRHVRKDGTDFPVLADITVIEDESGTAVSHVKIIHDLTEMKRTSEALLVTEARARSLFENASQAILTTDSTGRIMDANMMTQELFGYSVPELIGAPVEMLLPESIRGRHAGHRAGYLLQPRARPMGQGMDLVARRRDGSEFPVEISLSYVAEHQGGLAIAFISDITRRKQADRDRERLISSLKDALAEKTVLLQEVHHRVKNNLAVVAALLGMQAKMMEGDRATVALWESQQRVLSMARIHEFLYATEHLDRVAFGKYVEQLANELWASYAVEAAAVNIRISADNIDVPVQLAIPCGLILNELLTNALKYAFPGGRRGEVTVRFIRLESGEFSLSCRDDGVGIPEGVNWQNSPSLGLRIVRILAKQIDGELTLDRAGGGTKFELRFPGAK